MKKKIKNPVAANDLGYKHKSKNNTDINNTSLHSQRQRLLSWLEEKPVTTLEARHLLNILMPAARVHELRHGYGHNIITMWTTDIDSAGRKHRVGKYCLLNGMWEEGKNG